jgi:hypothetical protein
MASRSVVVNISPEDGETIRELAREAARQLSTWSSVRSVVLVYGHELKSCAPKSMAFDNLLRQRGAVWIGNYKGPIVSVEKLTQDLRAAWRDYYGETHGG